MCGVTLYQIARWVNIVCHSTSLRSTVGISKWQDNVLTRISLNSKSSMRSFPQNCKISFGASSPIDDFFFSNSSYYNQVELLVTPYYSLLTNHQDVYKETCRIWRPAIVECLFFWSYGWTISKPEEYIIGHSHLEVVCHPCFMSLESSFGIANLFSRVGDSSLIFWC